MYGSILYMCIGVVTSTNINMRSCMAKMCLDPSALFVLSPKQADWFNCPGPLNMSSKNPPSGEKTWSTNGLMWTQMCYFKTCGNHQFLQYPFALWGHTPKSLKHRSRNARGFLACLMLNRVQPQTYYIDLYHLHCLRRVKPQNWFIWPWRWLPVLIWVKYSRWGFPWMGRKFQIWKAYSL